jgi:nucleoside-diphosphate-sugar epimerase
VRIAIAGASGRLGRALSTALSEEHEIVPIEGDLRDPEVTRRGVDGCDAVVHLAAHLEGWPDGLSDGELLDTCARGTFELTRAAVAARVPRVVLVSTLDLMEAYPPGWAVHEGWRPRPSTELRELGPYVAELSVREMAKAGWPLSAVCLRLGRVVDHRDMDAHVPDARWLHLEDAVEAIRRALVYRPGGVGSSGESPNVADGSRGWAGPEHGWFVFHIPGGTRARFPLAAGHASFGFRAKYDFGHARTAPEHRSQVDERGRLVPSVSRAPASGPIKNVAVFGASGPLAAAVTLLLTETYVLRMTDVLSPEEGAVRIAARWSSWPRPVRLSEPHEMRQVDITDGDSVLEAAEGMDALLNCTVVREQAAGAFRVNTLGAYNVMRAAVAHQVKRVVHTGPQVVSLDHPAGYGADFGVPDEAPIRAGANVYFHSKYLGLEICRVFAENYGVEVLALLFSTFVNPQEPGRTRGRLGPATVSWNDAGDALQRALDISTLPSTFEVIRILGDLPSARFTNEKAKRVLGWAPRDSLLHLWQTEAEEAR